MSFDDDESMQKKWKAFCRKIDVKTDNYSIILRTIQKFLIKPFIAVINEDSFSEYWIANKNVWEQGDKSDG